MPDDREPGIEGDIHQGADRLDSVLRIALQGEDRVALIFIHPGREATDDDTRYCSFQAAIV
jgi:hypothetical protein